MVQIATYRTAAFALAAAFLGLALAGCGSTVPFLANQPPTAAAQRLAAPSTGRISVGPNDTVYTISKRYGIPVRDIIEANGLKPPFALAPGQDLRLPPPNRYVVRPGDTVFSISQRFGVDMRTVVEMNRIAPPYQIRVGQTLRLPSRSRDDGGVETAARETRADDPLAPSVVALPIPHPRYEKVEGGPEMAEAAQPASAAATAPETPAPQPLAQPLPAAEPPATSAAPTEASRSARSAAEIANIRPPARGGNRFEWPVRGRVIAGFGPREGGLHNDGINIAAPKGSPVRAAENGVVAYAGEELAAFGRLLLIKHADGWITAYAHNDTLLVQRGDVVKRGQTIATVGSSGSVTQPQLHFEIRHEKRAVDPRKHLDS